MRAAVLVGLLVALAVAVVAFAADLMLVGYAGIGAGGLWLACVDGQDRPIRPESTEIEKCRRVRRG